MSQLKGNEFIDPKFFDELKKGAEESLSLVKELKKTLKSDLQNKSTIKIVEPKTIQDINNFNKSVKETRTVIDNLTKAEAKELQLQKEVSKLKNDKVYQKQAKEIERLRQEKNAINKATRDEVKAEREVNNEYAKQSRLLNNLRKEYKNLAVAGKANTKQAKDLLAQIKPLDKELKEIDATVGQNFRSVGNYEKALGGLKKAIGFLGIGLGINALKNFGQELNELSNRAKGVEFAFNRLGERGQDAFERVRKSTRGLLSNLDIKTSLVELDNFNISLEQSDTLFEFLAVRSAQTGQSIDNLKSSLVEGLSKESKLRIDNLGISTAQLNEELEKTPNFVEAVANIAKKEVAEAGTILDDASNSQEKWNARIENTKLALSRGLVPVMDAFYRTGVFIIDNFKNIIRVMTPLAVAFTAYRVQVALANKEGKLSIFLSKAQAFSSKLLSTITGLLTGKIKFSTLAFKGLNTVMKANPIGLVITAVTTLISVFSFLNTETEENTELTKENTIEQRKNAEALNQRTNELEELQKQLNEGRGITSLTTEDLKDLKSGYEDVLDLTTGLVKEYKVSDKQLKGTNKERESYLSGLIRETDISNEAIQQLIKRSEALKSIDETNKELLKRGAIKERKDKEELTRLAQLRKDLKETNKEREKILNSPSDSTSEKFKSLTSEAENLKKEIKLLQDILDGKERDGEELITEKSKLIDVNEDVIDSEKEVNSVVLDLAESLNKNFKSENEKLIESRKQTYQSLNNISEAFAQRQQDRSNREVENIDRVINASQNRVDKLREFANIGNLTAQNSIALEEKAQAEATLKKEKEIQKQKRIESSLALLKTYTSSLEGGQTPSQAIADVLKNGTLLAGLINALPSFDVGTDNTSKHIAGYNGGVDGKGGFLAINHPNEKIFNAQDSAKIGFDVPNSEVAETFGMVKRGLLVPKSNSEVVLNWQSNEAILNKFDSLEKTVKSLHIPEVTYDFDNIEKVVTKIIKGKNSTNRISKKSTGIW